MKITSKSSIGIHALSSIEHGLYWAKIGASTQIKIAIVRLKFIFITVLCKSDNHIVYVSRNCVIFSIINVT